MRRIPVAIITLVGSLVVAACSGRDTTAPRGIAPGLSSAATVPPGPATTCDFTAINKAAKSYFTSGADPVYDYLKSMANAYKTSGAIAATPYGWSALGQVVSERLTAGTTDGSAGSIFVVDVLRCMADLSTTPATVPLSIRGDFITNAALILNSGIFDIRTGGSSGGPALGKVLASGVRAFGEPRWGVEATTGTTPWPGATGLQYLVYGYPLMASPLLTGAVEIDSNDDRRSTYVANGVAPFNEFELGTLPYDLPRTGLRVGMCSSAADGGTVGEVNRLVHSDNQILATNSPTQMCDPDLIAALATPSAWYASLFTHTVSLFVPQKLYAFEVDCSDCIGGLPSGWSPFSSGHLSATGVNIVIDTQPANTSISLTDSIVVRALYGTTGTVPVGGVRIDTITVSNNSGTPAGAIVTSTNTSTDPTKTQLFTKDDGRAKIYFQLGKAGGYLITVYSSLDGQSLPPVTTALFNTKNQ